MRKIKLYIFLNKYILLPIFGTKKLLKFFFKLKKGQKLDFNELETFNQKIQKRKLEENNDFFILCADKDKVREYVSKKIGEKYLIPMYFSKSKIEKKDLELLPNSFILKTNNASKTNIIVFDKEKENISSLVKTMNKYVKLKFGYAMLELFYNNIQPKVVAEKLLLGEDGNVPYDYKFHYFYNGGKEKIFVQVDYDRCSNHGRNIYNENWELQPFTLGFESDQREVDKPEKFGEMIEVVKKLANKLNYVRVDLYYVDKNIYFGELTFTHGGGYEDFYPEEYDLILGEYWK